MSDAHRDPDAAREPDAADRRAEIARIAREYLSSHGDFPDWDAVLTYLGEKAKRRKLVVILDEFPYLVQAEPALPSIIQRFWDHKSKDTKLKLVLCGSAQAVMEQLQAERAPLFGRVDVRLQIRPFRYDEAALFLPRLSPPEQAIAYGVVGGMPTYLHRWRDKVSHKTNLRRLFADPTSPLLEEGEFVLSNELHEGAGYFRILRAIASGHRTYGAIRKFADIEVQRQLEQLQGCHIFDQRRHARQTCPLGRTPAPFTGDQLIASRRMTPLTLPAPAHQNNPGVGSGWAGSP